MKKTWLTILAFVGIAGAVIMGRPHQGRVGPAFLYPDPKETPCLIATSDFAELTANYNGKTYSQAHRKTSAKTKQRVCDAYPENCKASREIDHCIPIALGGADDLRNLWAEPEIQNWNGENWGFRRKDALESYMVAQMKAGKITPNEAQECFSDDWVKCYTEYMSDRLGSGTGGAPIWDGEDEVEF